MSFGYYNLGAGLPSRLGGFRTPEVVKRVRKIEDFARASADVSSDVLKGSNILAGQSGGDASGYYKQGADVGGAWIATPGFLNEEILRLVGEARSLGRDISSSYAKTRSKNLNRFIQNAWSPYLTRLISFAGRHESWYKRLWGSLYTEIQEYRKTLIGLRRVAIGLGVSMSSPEPLMPPEPAISHIGKFIKTVLYFIVGGVILFFAFKIISPFLEARGSTI